MRVARQAPAARRGRRRRPAARRIRAGADRRGVPRERPPTDREAGPARARRRGRGPRSDIACQAARRSPSPANSTFPATRNCSRRRGSQKASSTAGLPRICPFFALRPSLAIQIEPGPTFRQTTERTRGRPRASTVANAAILGRSPHSSSRASRRSPSGSITRSPPRSRPFRAGRAARPRARRGRPPRRPARSRPRPPPPPRPAPGSRRPCPTRTRRTRSTPR